MDDLISRKDAIRWIKTECNPYGKPTLDFESGKRVMKHLEQMPPAQPKPSEITDEQAILHLQSTGWMQNHDREMYESGLREQLADDSGGYGSLIPCEDTISRQAAINAIDCINEAEEVLRSLPPAQPEEAIPVSWIEARIKRFMTMDNAFGGLTANIMLVMLNEWKREQEGETT